MTVIASLIVNALFFGFVAYVEILTLRDNATSLDELTARLNMIAELAHVKWMAPVVTIGAMLSFFSLPLSRMNTGSRVIFATGRHRLFNKSMATSHTASAMPNVAIRFGKMMVAPRATCRARNRA